MLTNITLTDRIRVPTQRKFTDSGQMIVPCAFARSGPQVYSAGALGIVDVKADTPVTVYRDEVDVFDDESITSFRSVPVTIGHPKKDGKNISVTADNSAELQVGVLEGMPVRDENKLTGTLVIARQDAIDMIEGGTQELSAGYTCDIEVLTNDDNETLYFQRNIRANHIAIVDKGRAGSSVRIADDAELASDESAKVEDEVVVDDLPVVAKTDEVVVDELAAVEVVDEATRDLKVGDEGFEVYTALQALNDEVQAVNWYVEAINYTEDEALRGILKYNLEEEQDHCTKLLGWLSTQNVPDTDKNSNLMDEAETVSTKSEVVVEDEAEAETGKTVEDVVVTDELVLAKETIAKLNDELDAGVEARVEIILAAKDLTDIDDYSGKSISDIRKLVVADLMPELNLDGKDEAYITARFDILCEDTSETSMSKVLRKNATSIVPNAKPVNIVDEARKKMISRHTSK